MINRLWASVYYGLIGLIVVFELTSVLDRDDHTPTLTKVLVTEVPANAMLAFCAWLLIHFAARYYATSFPYWYVEIAPPVLLFFLLRK